MSTEMTMGQLASTLADWDAESFTVVRKSEVWHATVKLPGYDEAQGFNVRLDKAIEVALACARDVKLSRRQLEFELPPGPEAA